MQPMRSMAAFRASMKFCAARGCWPGAGASIRTKIFRRGRARRSTASAARTPVCRTTASSGRIWMRGFAELFLALAVAAPLTLAADNEARSFRAQADVTPDTNPDSPFWKGVAAVIADRDQSGKPVPAHRTEIRSRWTDDNLYFLFICPYQELYLKPNGDLTKETFGLWKWDVAEAFLGTDFQNIRRYREFE